jgi:phage gp36-like protein
MAYCSYSDVLDVIPESKLIELTDDAGSGSVDTDIVNAAISKAADLIDGYLGQIVTLPLTTTPAPLKGLNEDLAVCELWHRYHASMPKQWESRCERAHGMLLDLAAGKISLYPNPEADGEGPGSFQTETRDKQFTVKELTKF